MVGMVTRASRAKKSSTSSVQSRKTIRKSPSIAVKNKKLSLSPTANVDVNMSKPLKPKQERPSEVASNSQSNNLNATLSRASFNRRQTLVASKTPEASLSANVNNNSKHHQEAVQFEFIAVDDQIEAESLKNDESDGEMIVETLNSESDSDSVTESQDLSQLDQQKLVTKSPIKVVKNPSKSTTVDPATSLQELQPIEKHKNAERSLVSKTSPTESENPRLAALANVYNVLVHEKIQDFYNCTSCKMRFTSIHEHIMKYHQNDNVVIRDVKSNLKKIPGSAHTTPAESQTHKTVKPKYHHANPANANKANVVQMPLTAQHTKTTAKPKRLSIMRPPASERQPEKKRKQVVHKTDVVANTSADQEVELFHCKACDMVFESVEEHVREHHSANEPVIVQNKTITPPTSPTKPISSTADTNSLLVETFHCQLCDVEFASVEEHIRDFHPTQTAQLIEEPANEPVMKKKYTSKKATADTPSYCSICDTQFLYAVSLKLHMRMHQPVKPMTMADVVDHTEVVSTTADCSAQQPTTAGGVSDEDAVIAAAKAAAESAASTKSTSIEGHGKKATFYCAICDKRFSTRSQAVHEESHRQVAASKSNLCDICNKSYDNPALLEKHRAVHGPRRFPVHDRGNKPLPYECRFCQKLFARPNEKIKHERCHTGDKPHSCHLCGKTFRIANSLSLHLRTHSEARPFVCLVCNKRYKTSVILSTHMLIHSDERPYQCRYCSMRVKTAVQLASHQNHHTKPFSCSECNRPFASMFELKGHILSHKNNSHNLKHVCQICGAAYTRDYALRSHMQEKHSDVAASTGSGNEQKSE